MHAWRETFFMGRAEELALFDALRGQAVAGRGTFARVIGGPGLGKSTLVERAAQAARESGHLACIGRALDLPGAPSLWPWVELGRAILAGMPVLAERARAEPLLSWLVGPPSAELEGDPPGPDERFLQFDAFSTLLREAEREAPLFLVIEDLHWADGATLSLLSFLAADVARRRLVLVGTTRGDLDLAEAPAAAGPRAQEVVLAGLGAPEVRDLLSALGSELSDRPEEVRALTGGNPFFVQEVARHLDSHPAAGARSVAGELSLAGVPPTLRQLLDERLGRLDGATRSLLEAAAVVGQQFDLVLTASVAGMPPAEALSRLSEALRAGVVRERRERPGSFEFAHALFSYSLREALSPVDRASAHGRAGRAIEAMYPVETESRAAELAQHYREAAVLGDASRAIRYLELAAQRAIRLGAPEEAATWFSDAAELVAQEGGDQRRRLDLLLEAARAHRLAGNSRDARRLATVVAEAARAGLAGPGRAAAAELLARAALATGPDWLPNSALLSDYVRLLDDALAALPPESAGLRARLLADKAFALRETLDGRVRHTLSSEALALARTSLSGAELRGVLVRHLSLLWDYHHREERIELLGEALVLAGTERYDLTIERRRILGYLEIGELGVFEREVELLVSRAAEWHQPLARFRSLALRATAVMIRGDIPRALALAAEAYAYGRRIPGNGAQAVFGAQVMNAEFAREGYAKIEAMIRETMPNPPPALVRLPYALARAHLGDPAAAAAVLDTFAAKGFSRVHVGGMALRILSELAEMCVLVGASRHAPALSRMIEPYAPSAVIDGIGWVFRGSASHYLGMLAALMAQDAPEHWERSDEHFAAAADFERSMGARLALARTLAASAAALLDRAGALGGDGVRGWLAAANERAREAHEIASELGLGPLRDRSASLLERIAAARKGLRGGPSARADGLTARELDVLRLIAEGLTNGEIAETLVLSPGTTRQYVSSILSKVGARSRSEAAAYAHRTGIAPGGAAETRR
jgi:DNA-binding CsgD family transcriptional regulator